MILLFLNLTNLISEIEQPFHVSLDICFLLRPKKPLHSAFLNFAKIFTSASYRPFQILSVMCFTMVPKIHIVQERPKKITNYVKWNYVHTCTFEEETTVPSPEFSLKNENIPDRNEPNLIFK